jgi:GNAT superfamily N-acetyltransferase
VRRYKDPRPLVRGDRVEGFDCGALSLNTWLVRYALAAAAADSARTFVTVDVEQERVVGYHALAAAAIEHKAATERVRSGMPRHAIPVILLARLAVDRSRQRQGLGAWLLADAMRRALSAAEQVGIRALVVHAIDEPARAFYERHGMSPSASDPQHLMILIKDIRAALDAASSSS